MRKATFPLNALPQAYNEVISWLSEICRSNKVEDHVVCYHNSEGDSYDFTLYTKEHRYNIKAHPYSSKQSTSRDGKVIGESNSAPYLGCTVTSRKPRAGEDWNRGNDLPDGSYNKATWDRIKNAIIAYELVKISFRQHTTTKHLATPETMRDMPPVIETIKVMHDAIEQAFNEDDPAVPPSKPHTIN